jgi:hypothetical protein
MPNPTNIPVQQNNTQSFFDSLNSPGTQPTVSDGEYDAVLSFFEERTNNVEAAQSLASAFLQACITQNVLPVTQLDYFKKLSQPNVDIYLAMFFNNTRYGTSLLGVNANQTVNPYILRTILP